MIGTDMFREFVKPELELTCARLPRTFYHLDGMGPLRHLDEVLSIDLLDGVQWICGAGHGPEEAWPEVRRKIALSGKKAQTFSSLDALAVMIEQAGTARGIHHRAEWGDHNDVEGARRKLAKFGID
jgi:hypothetical protein